MTSLTRADVLRLADAWQRKGCATPQECRQIAAVLIQLVGERDAARQARDKALQRMGVEVTA